MDMIRLIYKKPTQILHQAKRIQSLCLPAM